MAGEKTRVAYVDRLRGLAVVTMFLVHSPYPWLDPAVNAGPYGRAISQIAGMVAPVFIFLAGVSVSIAARRATVKGADEERRARLKIALRGAMVLLAGYGLQAVFFSFHHFSGDLPRVFKVDILHCIGASLALAAWLMWPRRGLNPKALAALIVMVLGAQITWRLGLADLLPDHLAGFLAAAPKTSRFPLLPYGGWVALGMFVGPIWYDALGDRERERRFWIILALTGVGLIAARYGMDWVTSRPALAARLRSVGEIKTTVSFFLFKGGVLFLLFVAARVSAPLLDRFPFPALVLFGRTSLFGYCVHLVLVYHVFGVFWRRSLGVAEHLAGVALLTAVMFALSWAWASRPVRFVRERLAPWRRLA